MSFSGRNGEYLIWVAMYVIGAAMGMRVYSDWGLHWIWALTAFPAGIMILGVTITRLFENWEERRQRKDEDVQE